MRDDDVSYLHDIVEYEECCYVLVGQLLNVLVVPDDWTVTECCVICWSLMKGLSLT
jgi:hypothetical protein